MLAKASRLTAEKEFLKIYRKGKRVSGHALRLVFLNTRQNANRFGFVVSKKDLAHATARNRVKRILRAQIAGLSKTIKTGHDVIIQGQRALQTARAAEIRAELEKLLKKAGLTS